MLLAQFLLVLFFNDGEDRRNLQCAEARLAEIRVLHGAEQVIVGPFHLSVFVKHLGQERQCQILRCGPLQVGLGGENKVFDGVLLLFERGVRLVERETDIRVGPLGVHFFCIGQEQFHGPLRVSFRGSLVGQNDAQRFPGLVDENERVAVERGPLGPDFARVVELRVVGQPAAERAPRAVIVEAQVGVLLVDVSRTHLVEFLRSLGIESLYGVDFSLGNVNVSLERLVVGLMGHLRDTVQVNLRRVRLVMRIEAQDFLVERSAVLSLRRGRLSLQSADLFAPHLVKFRLAVQNVVERFQRLERLGVEVGLLSPKRAGQEGE